MNITGTKIPEKIFPLHLESVCYIDYIFKHDFEILKKSINKFHKKYSYSYSEDMDSGFSLSKVPYSVLNLLLEREWSDFNCSYLESTYVFENDYCDEVKFHLWKEPDNDFLLILFEVFPSNLFLEEFNTIKNNENLNSPNSNPILLNKNDSLYLANSSALYQTQMYKVTVLYDCIKKLESSSIDIIKSIFPLYFNKERNIPFLMYYNQPRKGLISIENKSYLSGLNIKLGVTGDILRKSNTNLMTLTRPYLHNFYTCVYGDYNDSKYNWYDVDIMKSQDKIELLNHMSIELLNEDLIAYLAFYKSKRLETLGNYFKNNSIDLNKYQWELEIKETYLQVISSFRYHSYNLINKDKKNKGIVYPINDLSNEIQKELSNMERVRTIKLSNTNVNFIFITFFIGFLTLLATAGQKVNSFSLVIIVIAITSVYSLFKKNIFFKR